MKCRKSCINQILHFGQNIESKYDDVPSAVETINVSLALVLVLASVAEIVLVANAGV